MKKNYCKDMGLNCHFVAEGMTDEEVMEKLDTHGKEVHLEEVKKMMENMSEEEMKKTMMSKIKEE